MQSIAARVAHAFHEPTVTQGFASWFKGEVEVTHSSERAFIVKVRGRRTNDVRLVLEAGRLLSACSCAARSLGVTVCKHLWAALLEADRAGALSVLRSSRARLAIEPLVEAVGPDRPQKQPARRRARRRTRVRRAPA
jgi:uncharacterized Zn finger protein